MKSFGCSTDIAEDYVQEMYIKIHYHIEKHGNELMYNKTEANTYFVYVMLKNMYLDDIKKPNKTERIVYDVIQDEREYNEIDFNTQLQCTEDWLEQLNTEIENCKSYTIEKAHLYYIKFIFDSIFINRISVSELSRNVGITYWSIRNTVNIIKTQIKSYGPT